MDVVKTLWEGRKVPLFEQRGPKTGTQKFSTKRGLREPVNAEFALSSYFLTELRRVTIRRAQPSARLSEEISLSEGSAGVSQRALQGLSEGLWGSDPMLATLGNELLE